MSTDQVVITGAGLITPLGLTRQETFAAVRAGRCGMGPLSALEQPLPEGKDGGQVPDLPGEMPDASRREVRYLRRAIFDALADAGLTGELPYAPSRCGLMLGTTLHGMRAAGRFLRSDNPADLREFLAADVLRDVASGITAAGFAATTCSACSSSLGSIALGMTMLQSGDFDLIIAGGYDPVSEYAYAGFNSLRLVCEGPLRPFCRERQGMKLSEGYGILVLERSRDAQTRKAPTVAVVAGFGESADAHHLTQPHPQGDGAARAMRQAIESAGISPDEIDLVVAHATGTPDNDASEHAALASVFGERLKQLPVVGFKSHLGHTLGGAGAVELILGAMAMQEGIVPPCANISAEEAEFPDMLLATGTAQPRPIRATLSTSLGFGGANTSVVLRPAASAPTVPTIIVRDNDETTPVITGIGVVMPGAIGNDPFLQLLSRPGAAGEIAPVIPEEELANLINARRTRRLSEYVKLMLAATNVALQDAAVTDVPAFAAECCAILGTTHGSSSYSEQYYRQIVNEGVIGANPMLFAEGVPNAASAHVSLMLGVKGACQTIIGSRTAGLDALSLAARRIRTGRWTRAIVGAAEERSDLTNRIYQHCGLFRSSFGNLPFAGEGGFITVPGAAVLIIESKASARARGARIRATIAQTASRRANSGEQARILPAIADALCAIGTPSQLITSANATWMDRAEARAIAQAYGQKHPTVSSTYGYTGETFSACGITSIAAALLAGRLPRLLNASEGLIPADGQTPLADFGVLCSDYSGVASAVRLIPSEVAQ